MNKVKSYIILVFTIMLISSCYLIEGIRLMESEDVKSEKYFYGDKSIIFVPNIHIGKKIYYDRLTDSIKSWKSTGFTIFYETIHTKNLDPVTLKLCALQWRKITGGKLHTRKYYAKRISKEKRLENKIPQPKSKQLGIDSTDINADISYCELIDQYEKIYGEVILDSCDHATRYDSLCQCSEALKNSLYPIVREYRNQQLSERIIKTNITKIVVLYGQAHIRGLKELLVQKQPLIKAKK